MSVIPQCKVPIGTKYRPSRFERRTPTEYQALMPRHGRDAIRLQRSLLSPEAKTYIKEGIWIAAATAVFGAMLVIGPHVGF